MFFFIESLSVLYISVTGTVKVVLVVLMSIIVFNDAIDLSLLNAFGIALALLAFGYNSYLTYTEKVEKVLEVEEAVTDRTDDSTVDETAALLAEDTLASGIVVRKHK